MAAQVVTIGLGSDDGRDEFPGIPFHSVPAVSDVGDLDGTVVFVTSFPVIATVNPAYQIMHVPPPLRDRERPLALAQARDRGLIATSRFAARLWSEFLDVDLEAIRVVYPFAEPSFGAEPRPAGHSGVVRVLYAGRLSPEKGIYTLLTMLHSDLIADLVEGGVQVTFTVTTAGSDKPQGRIIQGMLEAHPGIRLVAACKTPAAMAALMVEHDIVVMPSNGQYWHETFGIVSIEAQHAGCRVVASDDGGLPETNCGALTLVVPDNADALAHGIREAVSLGAVSGDDRTAAATRFTVAESVDELLAVIGRPRPIKHGGILGDFETLVRLAVPTHRTRPIRSTTPTPASTPPGPKPTVVVAKVLGDQVMGAKPPRRQLPKQAAESLKATRVDKREN